MCRTARRTRTMHTAKDRRRDTTQSYPSYERPRKYNSISQLGTPNTHQTRKNTQPLLTECLSLPSRHLTQQTEEQNTHAPPTQGTGSPTQRPTTHTYPHPSRHFSTCHTEPNPTRPSPAVGILNPRVPVWLGRHQVA